MYINREIAQCSAPKLRLSNPASVRHEQGEGKKTY